MLAGWLWMVLGAGTLAFSGISIGITPSVNSRTGDLNGTLAETVVSEVTADFLSNDRVGLVVGAISGQDEVLLGFGKRSLGDSRPPNGETVFEIGSISKTFTGIMLAKQIQEGGLKVDDRIKDLLPEGWELSEAANEVSLGDCTTHTSGIPRLPSNLFSASDILSVVFGGDPYRNYSEEEFQRALQRVELMYEPGTQDTYSNFAVGLLGFVLATQKQTDYAELLRSEVCEPLNMQHTTSVSSEWQYARFAPGYRSAIRLGPIMVALNSTEWQLPNHLAGAGGIRSNGNDMMRYLRANMSKSSSQLDAAIRLAHRERYESSKYSGYGMNWVRTVDPTLAQTIIWHNGGTGGYRTYLGFTEDQQVGVFVLSNTSTSVDGLGRSVIRSLVRQSTGGMKLVTAEGYAKVAPFSGVRWDDDQPIVQVHGAWSPLVSIDGISVVKILSFAKKEFDDKAKRRFAEDLVEVLAKMNREMQWTVALELRQPDGKSKTVHVMMTEENRQQVRESRINR